jgi:hypothetical protein
VHLLRTKLLLARVLTLALLVAIAASPFGRAPLGATLAAAGHAHCAGHTSADGGATHSEAGGHQTHAHGTVLDEPARDAASGPSTPAPQGDPGCCLTAVGVEQKPLAAPLPFAIAMQRLAARDDAAVADLSPDGPQRPPRTRDHA